MSLAGRTILVTRGATDAEAWATRLEAHGARSVVFPCIAYELFRDPATRGALADALDDADWLALTSRRGAEGVAALIDQRRLEGVRVAAVGNVTADAARRLLGRVDLVASGGTARSLGQDLARYACVTSTAHVERGEGSVRVSPPAGRDTPVEGEGDTTDSAKRSMDVGRPDDIRRDDIRPDDIRPVDSGGASGEGTGGEGESANGGPDTSIHIVVAGARTKRRELEQECASRGCRVTRVALYRTISAPPQHPREDLAARDVDTIFLASPSAVAGLVARAVVPPDARIVTIGPTTSAAAREAGLQVTAEATHRGLRAMIEAAS